MFKSFSAAAMIVSVIAVSGCATALLPQGPDVYTLAALPNAPAIVIVPPIDERADKQRLGSISAVRVTLKDDPTQLLAKELVVALHERNINGVLAGASETSPQAYAQLASDHQAWGVLALTIQSIAVESFDALMDPPTATVTLGAILYDNQGNVVEKDSVVGQVKRRINTFVVERSTGELVGEAIHDATQRLTSQGATLDALERLTKGEAQ